MYLKYYLKTPVTDERIRTFFISIPFCQFQNNKINLCAVWINISNIYLWSQSEKIPCWLNRRTKTFENYFTNCLLVLLNEPCIIIIHENWFRVCTTFQLCVRFKIKSKLYINRRHHLRSVNSNAESVYEFQFKSSEQLSLKM